MLIKKPQNKTQEVLKCFKITLVSKIEQKFKVAEYLDNNENKKITFQNL